MSVLAILEGAGLTARLSPALVDPQILVSPLGLITPVLRGLIIAERETLLDELEGRLCAVLWPPIPQTALDAIVARWKALERRGMLGAGMTDEAVWDLQAAMGEEPE